jgi:2-hydroxychromene-2-carboxylate isomerase
VLPERPEWRPIAFGVIVQRIGKRPWSFAEDRSERFAEIDARAVARGLPPLRYPDGWPRETYSLLPLRAALLAADQEQLRALTRELYRTIFVDGVSLSDPGAVLDAAERAGMDRAAVEDRIESDEVKEHLRAQTAAAIERGVTGIPTVAVGDELFWGDDRLEDAAGALAG